MSVELQTKRIKTKKDLKTSSKKFYIESYGCQMNFADSEVVASIISKEGYDSTQKFK
jgi:tRNA-2-methylthio-N6-dimethylallyladenosine synthase